MNLPPVNSYGKDEIAVLFQRLTYLEKTDEVKVVILTSALKVFCAGMNLKDAIKFSEPEQVQIFLSTEAIFSKMFLYKKPLIVAVPGAAIAGGFFPIACGDFVIASKYAKFQIPEVRVGLSIPPAVLVILEHALNPNDMRCLVQSGSVFYAKDAFAKGIVDQLSDEGMLITNANLAAEKFLEICPDEFFELKKIIRGPSSDKIQTILADYKTKKIPGWFSNETRSAMKSILNK